jgi:hypothetical protein
MGAIGIKVNNESQMRETFLQGHILREHSCKGAVSIWIHVQVVMDLVEGTGETGER